MSLIKIICSVLLTSTMVESQSSPSLLESVLHLLMVDGSNNFRKEPRDQRIIYKEYDFIVVGAGTAGCVVANRLSEIPNWKVLLIEAGREENFLMDIPIIANYLQFFDTNWKYKTQSSSSFCLGMEKNQCHWPRGKVVGGSSVLNYMIFTRGNRRDYDRWKALGNKGWGWDDVLYYFRKMENMQISDFASDLKHHSTNGYVSISQVPYKTPIAKAFVQAGQQMGQPVIDYNGPTQTGFNYLQVSMKNGTRWSSAKAYLYTAANRPNLHVKKQSMVSKIIIDPKTKTTVGVEFISRGVKYVIRARKEVILSAGTINSPQLLMLSGIGPKNHLTEKKIKVIQDSKVGYNLQDHTATGALTYLIDYPYSLSTNKILESKQNLINFFSFHDGVFSIPGGCEALGFIDTKNLNNTDGYPDIELLLVSGSMASEETLYKDMNLNESLFKAYFGPIQGKDSFMILPMTLRPKSVGRIMLRDNNPFHHPLIYPNYFSDKKGYDIKMAVAGIRASNKLVNMPAFKKLGARLYKNPLPTCKQFKFDSDEYWNCFTRHFTFTIYHHVGTCKMGPDSDPNAVVDDRLRVRGVKKLRVIDASIMPLVPAAHTNAPTFMIAEKGSDMIKQDWGFSNSIDLKSTRRNSQIEEEISRIVQNNRRENLKHIIDLN